jgi:hypothetical protein
MAKGKKISAEVRQEILKYHQDGMKTKDIYELMFCDVSISTINRIIREGKEKANVSITSVGSVEEFKSFIEDDQEEQNTEVLKPEEQNTEIPKPIVPEVKPIPSLPLPTIEEFKNVVKESTLELMNKIQESPALDKLIQQTKTKPLKPIKYDRVNPFPTDELSEQEKRIRLDLLRVIRCYIKEFEDEEVIHELTSGNPTVFRQKLCEKDIKQSNLILEEIQIGLQSNNEYENFMKVLHMSIRCLEFITKGLIGTDKLGLYEEILNEISLKDLKMLACELSVSRIITPQRKLIFVTISVLMRKIMESDVVKDPKLKLMIGGLIQKVKAYMGK